MLLAGHWTIGSWRCNHRGSSPIRSHNYLRDRAGLSWRKNTPPALSIENTPLFTTDAQEKSWLYLFLNTAATPFRRWRIIRYSLPKSPVCCWRDATGAVKRRSVRAAQKLLATLPANEMLEERYTLAWRPVTRLKLCVWHDCCITRTGKSYPPGSTDLATDAERQSREAADLLLQRYPFQGDARSARL